MNINIVNIGDFCLNKVNIKIIDCNNKIVIDDFINRSTCYNICRGIYNINVYVSSNLLCSYSVLHNNKYDFINLYINTFEKKCKIFYLYDYFYKGLKIKRGEIKLGA